MHSYTNPAKRRRPANVQTGGSAHAGRLGPTKLFTIVTLALAALTAGMLPCRSDGGEELNCVDCHRYDATLNHPIDVPASPYAPADLPLDAAGNMTCLTCHEEPAGTTGEKMHPTALRRQRPEQLCDACHANHATSLEQRAHARFSTEAHLVSLTPGKPDRHDRSRGSVGIDRETRGCLSCHEGIGTEMRRMAFTPGAAPGSSGHPIGMVYEQVATRNPAEYYAPATLGAGVRLIDGQVACGSCHSLYNQAENHLVAPTAKGELCRNCHNKG